MTAIEVARAALVAAEQERDRRALALDNAHDAMGCAELAYGDDPTEERAAAFTEARAAQRLAAVALAGAARKADAAKDAVQSATRADASERLAANAARASREALFRELAPSIMQAAALDAIPRLDTYSLDDASFLPAAREQGARDIDRALCSRRIRRALDAHAAAVDAARSAAAELGEQIRLDPVAPRAIDAAIRMEAHVITADAVDAVWWSSWFRDVCGEPLNPMRPTHRAVDLARGNLSALAQCARETLLDGQAAWALKRLDLRTETEHERGFREHNERAFSSGAVAARGPFAM